MKILRVEKQKQLSPGGKAGEVFKVDVALSLALKS